MKTPLFWQSKNLISTLLLPLASLYKLGGKMRGLYATKSQSLSVPVICVGNLTAGGAGKTPVAIAIGERLKTRNINAYFLSKGYGGSLRGPVIVNREVHTAQEVGDEPLLLARVLPTIVAKDRLAGAQLAMQEGAKAIVMDDGFQNPAFVKSLSLLVIDGYYGFGNERLLPAGPLRETPESGIARADAAIVIGGKSPQRAASLPAIAAQIVPAESAKNIQGRKVFAFCGLAFPQKFFDTVTVLGATLAGTKIFGDHHLYSEREMNALAQAASEKQAILVTTAKDAVRLSPEWRARVTVVDISLKFDKPELLDSLLAKALKELW